MGEERVYHIYFEKSCIFKDISEFQFKLIWELLNTEYNSELSYTEITVNPTKQRELIEDGNFPFLPDNHRDSGTGKFNSF